MVGIDPKHACHRNRSKSETSSKFDRKSRRMQVADSYLGQPRLLHFPRRIEQILDEYSSHVEASRQRNAILVFGSFRVSHERSVDP